MYMGGWPGIAYMPPRIGIGMGMPPWIGTLCMGPARSRRTRRQLSLTACLYRSSI